MKKLGALLAFLAGAIASPVATASQKHLTLRSGQFKVLQAGNTVQINAPTMADASINLPLAAASTTPTDGDCRTTASNMFCRVNGAMQGPLLSANGTVTSHGASNLQYLGTATGASDRSASSGAGDGVSITDFSGCDKTGIADSTACIQAALNAGARSVYIPTGLWKFRALTMPKTVGFTLFGDGASSVLIQTGRGISWAVQKTFTFNSFNTIRDLSFDGTSGTGHTLSTQYVQTIDLRNLRFNNVPVGFSSLFLNGNPSDGTYMHDVRAMDIRVYNGINHGRAGIELGALASDTLIDRFIMEAGFTTDYCLLASAGAQTTVLSNSHPYNALINVVKLSGSNNDFAFSNDVLDNAKGDIVYILNSISSRWNNVYIESVNPGFSGAILDNSYNHTFTNTAFGTIATGGNSLANAGVVETNGSGGNKFFGGSVDNPAKYAKAFALNGIGSFSTGFQQDTPLGFHGLLRGVTAAATPPNSVTNLGANGANAVFGNTAWRMDGVGRAYRAKATVDVTPAAGQNFTFNLRKNNTTIGTAVISNGSFTATITVPLGDQPFVDGDMLYIQEITSALSGSATPSYSIEISQ
jgi:hypothetical protein